MKRPQWRKNEKKNHPRERRISLMKMIEMVLGYPEVHTGTVFVTIPTCPLEHRSGTESCNKSSSIEDGAYLELETIILREEKDFPERQLHTDSQKLVLNGLR